MRDLVKSVDVVIANEEDCQMALGIRPMWTSIPASSIAAQYQNLTAQVLARISQR